MQAENNVAFSYMFDSVLTFPLLLQLVDNPVDALVFLPQLLPDLKKAADEIANPEARSVCSKAVATLELMEKEAKEILGEEVKKTDKDVST